MTFDEVILRNSKTFQKAFKRGWVKALNNMKTRLNKKTDKTATGIKPINLKVLEGGAVKVLQKIPILCSVEFLGAYRCNSTNNRMYRLTGEKTIKVLLRYLQLKLKKIEKMFMQYETDETEDLPQMQRLVLLLQLQLKKTN